MNPKDIPWTRVGRGLQRFLDTITGPRLQLWALILAAPVFTALVAWLVQILQSRGWPLDQRATQLGILANIAYGALALLGLVVLAIASGLITGVKISGPGGFSAEVDTEGQTVTARAEAEVTVEERP